MKLRLVQTSTTSTQEIKTASLLGGFKTSEVASVAVSYELQVCNHDPAIPMADQSWQAIPTVKYEDGKLIGIHDPDDIYPKDPD
jgi:hypothetical protein